MEAPTLQLHFTAPLFILRGDLCCRYASGNRCVLGNTDGSPFQSKECTLFQEEGYKNGSPPKSQSSDVHFIRPTREIGCPLKAPSNHFLCVAVEGRKSQALGSGTSESSLVKNTQDTRHEDMLPKPHTDLPTHEANSRGTSEAPTKCPASTTLQGTFCLNTERSHQATRATTNPIPHMKMLREMAETCFWTPGPLTHM